MRPRATVRFPSAAALLLLAALAPACASRKDEKIPTLADYSDGTSVWSDDLLAGWRAGSLPADLFVSPTAWSGPLPGEGLREAGAAPPLSVATYEAAAAASAPAAPADVRGALGAVRSRFATVARSEATILDFRRRGEDRVILL